MPQVLQLQDLNTDNGPDEEGLVAASSMSIVLGCESNTSVVVC
ncbi:SapB/AmfS family lanthipeptide [Streptomyces sp. NPDC059590]